MGDWVAWVRKLRGSNFYVGCVGYVGHNFCVGSVGQIYFCLGLCVRQNILSMSKTFAWVFFFFFFFVGQLLFTRWDYFTILQLIVWEFFFSLVSSQQILTKPCLTPLVFLNRICKIDDIQWYFYERATKFYFWAANWPYSQRGCEYSKTSCSSQTPQASFENSTHLWKLFTEKKILKECCIMS